MKHATMRLLSLMLVLAMLVSALPVVLADAPRGEKIVYGYSGEGRELTAYRFGDGKNVMVIGFAIHGFEDNFNRDGEALVYTAERLMDTLKQNNMAQERGWTVYVLPCMNPDGLYGGWTQDGPGRCTTKRYDDNGKLVEGGIDLNRCFPQKFTATYTPRNYTGPKPMGCPEAVALSTFIQKVKGSGKNVLIDTHGWYQQIIVHTDRAGTLYQAFHENFPQNVYTYSGKGQGYFTEYAYALGYDTCLFEFPDGLYSMSAYRKSGYCEKYISSIKTILCSVPSVCADGHDYTVTTQEPTCTEDGREVKVCSRCGDSQTNVLKALGHDYSEDSVQKIQLATATRDGFISYACIRCGAEEQVFTESRAFWDTSSSAYYADAVDYAYENELVKGLSVDTFGPNVNLSRGMLVTILYRYAGKPAITERPPFKDVRSNQYFADAVAWAYENGVVKGMSASKFAPNDSVTRQQVAAILFRYAGMQGKDNGVRADFSDFDDAYRVNDYAADSMAWCLGNGILTGTSATTLSPRSNASRAQSLVMLYRMIQYLANAEVVE